MSKYTTGELAKLCGVTVRTVQYYDTRGVLSPSELTEGGRRLYSEEDAKKMQVICFLRELDLPLHAISDLLSEEHPENVIDLLLTQQEVLLREEIEAQQKKLSKLTELRRMVRSVKHFSVESLGDMAYQMENRKKLRRVRTIMLGVGIPLEIIEWVTLIFAIRTGIWWLFAIGLAAVIGGTIWIVQFYYKNVSYICPQCHTIFKPAMKQFVFSNHTPNTRKLTCPECGHMGFCVEVYAKQDASAT